MALSGSAIDGPRRSGLLLPALGRIHWRELARVLVRTSLLLVVVVAGFAAFYRWYQDRSSAEVVAYALVSAIALLLLIWDEQAYIAALLATAPAVPTIASIFALTLYMTWEPKPRAFAAGTLLVLPVWLIAALLFRRIASVERASPSNYAKLCAELTRLKACTDALRAGNHFTDQQDQLMALREAGEQLKIVDSQLHPGLHLEEEAERDEAANRRGRPSQAHAHDLRWVYRTGYSDLWERLHRAEEALVDVMPRSQVVTVAVQDEQRLEGSKVENRGSLLRNLRRAAYDLDPSAALRYLEQPPQPPAQDTCCTATSRPDAAATGNGAAATEAAARGVIRGVRNAINVFRDGRFDGIIQARNRLYLTGMFTSIVAYLLLGVAIIRIPALDSGTIVAATVFYLVGALVGLFNRLGAEAEADSATEDYGLSAVRLFYTPLFSGLAAVGGVLLVALIPSFEPSSTDRPGGDVPFLGTIFHLEHNQLGLVVAAVFGLTPSLLISRLKRETDRYKSDLKSIELSASQ